MTIKHEESFHGEHFEIHGFDNATIFGFVGSIAALLQFLLAFSFNNTIGFAFALSLLANPLVLGVLAMSLSKGKRNSFFSFGLGFLSSGLSCFFYFIILLPKVENAISLVYVILPFLSLFLVAAGLLIRYFRRHDNMLPEIALIALGTTVAYVIYLGLWIDVFFKLFGG